MAAAPEFDREEFEAWLNKQPREVSFAIAARAALRVLPLLSGFSSYKFSDGRDFGEVIVLSAFHGLALPCVDTAYPMRNRELAAVDAVADAAAAAAAAASAATAAEAGYAADAAAAYASAASSAASAAYTAHSDPAGDAAYAGAYAAAAATHSDAILFYLAATATDRAAIDSGVSAADLASAPLWPDGGMSDDLRENWESLKSELLALDEDWQVWTDWYEARIEGREANEALEVARVTLPEALWREGPKAVNSEILNLTELSQGKDGDRAIASRMEELRREYPEVGSKAGQAEASSAEPSGLPKDLRPGFPPNLSPSDLPNVWILQYRPGDRVTQWTSEAVPGSTIRWKTEKALPKAMRAGDPVIYWRTIDPDDRKDRGGIVGTGHILSAVAEPEPDGILRFPSQVHEFDEAGRIDRDLAIEFAGITRKNWRGAILDLPMIQAIKLDELLRREGHAALFTEPSGPQPAPEPRSEPSETDGQIHVRRDDAERDHDALGRAPLAVSLAWTLHEIWCNEQGLKPFRARKPQTDAAGFVAHIDAPWGGGKTSFANLVERTLNPDLDGKVPEFLETLYSDRDDMSGLFIKHTHETGKLRDAAGNYLWADAARRPWIIVPFNAWLNQHVDPPWWSFYETLRKSCFSAIRKDGLSQVFQRDDGNYHTIRQNSATRFARWASLWFKELWWRFWTPEMRNSLIGFALTVVAAFVLYQNGLFDLKALGAVFSSPAPPPPVPVDKDVAEAVGEAAKEASTGFKVLATMLIVLLGGASVLKSVFAVFTQTLLPGTADAAKNYSLGSDDPLARFRRHFGRMMREIGRPVLVVIDDIDRCEPKFIVEMARGLQTILKSPRVVYLLLGDRNWIEQAFEVCHTDMKNIDVGPEHTFGGRFVEKAIQLSFVLPTIGEHKEDYVREVLTGRGRRPAAQTVTVAGEPVGSPGAVPPSGAAGDDKPSAEISKADRQELRATISKARTVQGIDEAGAAQLKGRVADPGFQKAVREEVILGRAAQKDVVEQEIGHRLEPLAQYLPGNPRHIKRIINAISMYQNSILLTEKDLDDAEFGGELWRRLVIGVVLMVGFPKSWSFLAKHPDWADLLIKKKPLPKKGTGTQADADFEALGNNADFVALLSETKLVEKIGGDPVKTEITPEVVRWLNRIIPVAAG